MREKFEILSAVNDITTTQEFPMNPDRADTYRNGSKVKWGYLRKVVVNQTSM
jgi:hypothetical protein